MYQEGVSLVLAELTAGGIAPAEPEIAVSPPAAGREPEPGNQIIHQPPPMPEHITRPEEWLARGRYDELRAEHQKTQAAAEIALPAERASAEVETAEPAVDRAAQPSNGLFHSLGTWFANFIDRLTERFAPSLTPDEIVRQARTDDQVQQQASDEAERQKQAVDDWRLAEQRRQEEQEADPRLAAMMKLHMQPSSRADKTNFTAKPSETEISRSGSNPERRSKQAAEAVRRFLRQRSKRSRRAIPTRRTQKKRSGEKHGGGPMMLRQVMRAAGRPAARGRYRALRPEATVACGIPEDWLHSGNQWDVFDITGLHYEHGFDGGSAAISIRDQIIFLRACSFARPETWRQHQIKNGRMFFGPRGASDDAGKWNCSNAAMAGSMSTAFRIRILIARPSPGLRATRSLCHAA